MTPPSVTPLPDTFRRFAGPAMNILDDAMILPPPRQNYQYHLYLGIPPSACQEAGLPRRDAHILGDITISRRGARLP